MVLASDEPMLLAKPVGLLHGLPLPEYQAKPCWPWAAAAASTPAKRSAQRFSTPSAIAKGRYFSNSSGCVGRRSHPVEPLALGDRQILLEAGDMIEVLRPSTRRR